MTALFFKAQASSYTSYKGFQVLLLQIFNENLPKAVSNLDAFISYSAFDSGIFFHLLKLSQTKPIEVLNILALIYKTNFSFLCAKENLAKTAL